MRQIEPKVFLIVDGHPVHHSTNVKKWIDAHIDQIRLFFLPGYSPELNPDEMLNHDVKRASCKIILNRLGIDEKLLFRSFFIRKYPKISAKFSARSIYNRFLSVLEHTFPSAPPFPCPKIILVLSLIHISEPTRLGM